MEPCPSKPCTTLTGSSRPPSAFRLMHHDAKKWRKAWSPYLGLLRLFITPAASSTGARVSSMLRWYMIAPVPVGNTRSSSPFGQASLHTLSAATTSGGSGTARVLDADLGAPMTL